MPGLHQLSWQYRALPDERRKLFQEVGKAGAEAAKTRGRASGAFGMKAREQRRQRKRDATQRVIERIARDEQTQIYDDELRAKRPRRGDHCRAARHAESVDQSSSMDPATVPSMR